MKTLESLLASHSSPNGLIYAVQFAVFDVDLWNLRVKIVITPFCEEDCRFLITRMLPQ